MAVLLLAYVVPYVYKRRTVVAEAPLDERYSEGLRMITTRTQTDTTNQDHGSIFSHRISAKPQERTMNTARTQRDDVRSLARNRARAAARIANRRAAQSKGLVLGGGLIGLALLMWILVAVTALTSVVGIVATIIAGGYFLGFARVVASMNSADDADRAIIESASRELSARKVTPKKSATREARATAEAEAARAAKAEAVAAAKAQVEALNRAARASLANGPVFASKSETAVAGAGVAREVAPEAAREVAAVRRTPTAARFDVDPGYTLKPTIQKRTVKPYVAPEQPTAAVPYRPTKVGETLGGAAAAAEVEVARTDVLGGGSALDDLLERRRA